MLDKYIITIIASLKLKSLLWPAIDDSLFIDKMTSRQKNNSRWPPVRHLRGLSVKNHPVDGYSCFVVSPKRSSARGTIVYIHGGAFILPINNLHWRLITHLARTTKQTVIVPLYPFVPENNYNYIHMHLKKVYEALIDKIDPSEVSVVGDSAGANLALVLLGLVDPSKQPRTVVVMSPVVDLRLSNPSIDAIADSDPLLPLDAIRYLLPQYYEGTSATDPRVSPLFANFREMQAELYILNGGKDLLSPDIELFHLELIRQEVVHHYIYEKQLSHAWPIFPLRSSIRYRDMIADWCVMPDSGQ